ncbi:FAD-binding oxidoreductase [Flavobacteriaceae bacterium S356]|uniref:FAD-binding oxidoreductase n=1 Tax=Asprobacillus argus TaxID=3076534 RepID=A0ABU3LFI7_9FLAO|nr:FAD-binding oxidoreductase [Flavobacteriaceae bacterium S356]
MNRTKVDYIIVGLGLAGIAFAEQLSKNGKTFIVYEDDSQTSSLVAGGVYNPVILKRFTPVWNAEAQLQLALPFYKSLEEKLHVQIDRKFKTKKAFKSIEDQNNWFAASDKPGLSQYMNAKISKGTIPGIVGSFGFGEVLETGRIDTHTLVTAYRKYLEEADQIRYQRFQYDKISNTDDGVEYGDAIAYHIVFTEGYGIVHNPYFNYLPLNEAKGELITIHAPELKIDFLLKSTLFVLPLGDDHYKVGATFNWKDKTGVPSEEGKIELIEKLKNVITVPYTIIDQTAGIRPTVKDRRPMIGIHPKNARIAVLNGLGTRGVMIAPTVAANLYAHIEHKQPLDLEIDIKRFE